MADNETHLDAALDGIDESKRTTLKRLVLTGAFVTPVVVSFAMTGLSADAFLHTASAASGPNGTILSDQRLKAGMVCVGRDPRGFGLYRFKYLWSDIEYVGVLAQQVLDVMPKAVSRGEDNFLRVNYATLGIDMVTYAEWVRRSAT